MQRVWMEITGRYIGEEGSKRPGDRVFVTERRAGQLEANGVAKREGAELKKPVSAKSGAATPSSVSPAAPVSQSSTSSSPAPEGGEQSQSTTPTVSPPGSTSSTPATAAGGTLTPRRGPGRPRKAPV